ncbi:MAG TPA: DEAD/DEAH box helicase, partial [Planctomycetaceae bacterium]|nr:DEAD/DEAH box helicase [Planctomycetaceae bacterium]
MSDDPLLTPVQFLKGVGPPRARLLEKLGIETVGDLLWHLPRDLLDLSDVRGIPDLIEDQPVSVFGRVVDLDGKHLSKGRTLSAVLIERDGSYLRGVWFNQNWVLKKFQHGQKVLFSGKPKRKSGRWEISHPRIQFLEDDDDADERGEVLPRYPLTEGIRMHEMRRMLREAVAEFSRFVPDPLPESFRKEKELPSLYEALHLVHTPRRADDYERGRNRLILDDLFEFQLGVALRRRAWGQKRKAIPLPVTTKIDSRIRRLFPFEFTNAQNNAIREILADMNSSSAMHRLLQADVGAGKTAIAIYAMLTCIACGKQAVLMAPTEVL